MTQSEIVKRTESICAEFDSRVTSVGIANARLELAKVLAESESELESAKLEMTKLKWHVNDMETEIGKLKAAPK